MKAKLVEGVKIVMNGQNPHESKIFFKVEGEALSENKAHLVHWPIDIHADASGVIATLRVPVVELEAEGIAVVEEP